MTRPILTWLFLLTVLSLTAAAEVPQLINYQGRLTDTDGEVVPEGNYSVTFRIYNDPVSEAELELLWEEGQLVTVEEGLFAVMLGAVVGFPADLFDGADRWLSIQVGLDPMITPRARLTSAPFAVHAASADNADVAIAAGHATSADNADVATTAGHATLADNADVATTSLDKTIDAGELIQGALDHERFSAFDDLVVEGKIGNSTGHVAAGDHVHPIDQPGIARSASTNVIEIPDGSVVNIETATISAPGPGYIVVHGYVSVVFRSQAESPYGLSSAVFGIHTTPDASPASTINNTTVGYNGDYATTGSISSRLLKNSSF